MSERWLIVGGGFRGIIGAYLLASQGKEVVLIERIPHLGGVLYSANWKGFYLDKGCHLFDNNSDITTSILMDILQGEVEPVSVRYASIINGIKTDGIAIPNLATYGEKSVQNILNELLAVLDKPNSSCTNLQEKLDARFGETASNYLASAAYKMYRTAAAELDADAFPLTPFRRIKFLDDSIANVLKESPTLDERIAASSQNDPMKYYRDSAQTYSFRNFYPKEHGLRGFCEKAKQRLEELGVTTIMGYGIEKLNFTSSQATVILSNGEEISGDRILWTAGIEPMGKLLGYSEEISKYIHHVPMVLYYFVIPKDMEGQYTYLHNFQQEDIFFRASVPGSYGIKTCPAGLSYVCCEVPTTLNSPQWHSPEDFVELVWKELQQYEVVREGRPLDTLTVKTPTSYKMPKVGYQDIITKITDSLKTEHRIIGADQWDFSKNDIINSLQNVLKEELQSQQLTLSQI
ncbi:MAG: NAD(P)-binding protein [Calothrix sp. MO_167.B42]|nr:NAD(P)-binding protein [Calothrix sp. MO_167.B42]